MLSEPLNPAGAGQNPEDFKNYTPDLAAITKLHMLAVYPAAGRELSALLIKAVKRAIEPEGHLKRKLTRDERDVLRNFARRGEEYFRWGSEDAGTTQD